MPSGAAKPYRNRENIGRSLDGVAGEKGTKAAPSN